MTSTAIVAIVISLLVGEHFRELKTMKYYQLRCDR